MKIKDFFNVEQPSANHDAVSTAKKTYNETSSKKIKSSSAQPAAAETMLTINLHIEKPDIILLEDMDNIDSNCIVLNVRVTLVALRQFNTEAMRYN